MLKLFALTVVMVSSVALAADKGADKAADAAFTAAKDAYQQLKKDESRRKFRHHWLNVAKKYDQVGVKFPKSDRAPEAIFAAAELYNELSRFSGSDEDVASAEKAYRKLLDGFPRHRLADDAALSLARLLADHEGDPAAARKLLTSALETANDRAKDIKTLLASLNEDAKRSEGAGKKARAEAKAAEPKHDADAEPKAARRAEPKPAEAARAADPKAGKHDTLADAIRRTGRAAESARAGLPNLAKLDEPAPAAKPAEETQGRRLPPARPAEALHDADDVDEEASPSAIAGLQERLRDVRVGAKKPDENAKARFKSLAREEGSAELTLAQQLGLKVRRVVVDAGHGGHDTGAIGPKGTREKDVALSIAQKLATRLEEAGLEVVQTRDDDSFVKLEDRTRFANKEKGDLFISIHCNAAPSKALRGIETYTLNTSSNRYSIRLAARENATTERGVGDLQYILADLATKANTGESTRLAQRVQKSLVENLSAKFKDVRDLGNKEALFFVLLGAKMPAILVETSFVSNADEEARLVSDDYQNQVADSIASAVSGFLEEREKQLAQLE